jgi:fatty acid/phospholipid biosynthesis enzyme
MKEKIQQRINQVRRLATTSTKELHIVKAVDSIRTNDSLSKSIRNSKEANIFLAELDAAIKVAQTKKD